MSEVPAFTNFQDIQKQSKVQIEALAAASASFAEKLESIASEAKDYSIKSFENSRKFSENSSERKTSTTLFGRRPILPKRLKRISLPKQPRSPIFIPGSPKKL